jgi:hypothetical protein
MTKQDIIDLVESAEPETDPLTRKLKDTVISYIESAYSIGFADGMARGTEVQSKIFEMVQESLYKEKGEAK